MRLVESVEPSSQHTDAAWQDGRSTPSTIPATPTTPATPMSPGSSLTTPAGTSRPSRQPSKLASFGVVQDQGAADVLTGQQTKPQQQQPLPSTTPAQITDTMVDESSSQSEPAVTNNELPATGFGSNQNSSEKAGARQDEQQSALATHASVSELGKQQHNDGICQPTPNSRSQCASGPVGGIELQQPVTLDEQPKQIHQAADNTDQAGVDCKNAASVPCCDSNTLDHSQQRNHRELHTEEAVSGLHTGMPEDVTGTIGAPLPTAATEATGLADAVEEPTTGTHGDACPMPTAAPVAATAG